MDSQERRRYVQPKFRQEFGPRLRKWEGLESGVGQRLTQSRLNNPLQANLSELIRRFTAASFKARASRVRFCISTFLYLTGLLILIGLGTLTASSGNDVRAKATVALPKFDTLTAAAAEPAPADTAVSGQSVTVNYSAPVTVRAAGRGEPFFNFRDGRAMPAESRGDQQLVNALQNGAAAPELWLLRILIEMERPMLWPATPSMALG